jgi:hypothetical protein
MPTKRQQRAVAKRRAPRHRNKKGQFASAPHKVHQENEGGGVKRQ